jgi:hypothetical protein
VDILKGLRRKLTKPTNEIAAHFLVSAMALIAIALIDQLLSLLGLGIKPLPLIRIPFNEWMFGLDIISATAVNVVGTIKAVLVLWEA